MSSSAGEGIPTISEMNERLSDEPFYIQRLGVVAFNAGIFEEFLRELAEGHSPKQLYGSVIETLHHEGVRDAEAFLEDLFEVPSLYD